MGSDELLEHSAPLYSVVIPVFNSEGVVEETVERTIGFFKTSGYRYEIILVNDGSSDGSWEKVRQLSGSHNNVVAIDLLKNYGQHSAVYCGVEASSGDFIITMDDDLQNPPEEIIHLIRKINEGYDLVFAEFHQKQHGLVRRWGTKLIGSLNNRIFHKPKNITLTNFRIFTRQVADRMLQYKTFFPYMSGLLLMFSSDMANVKTEHHPRNVGSSNYNIFRIARLVARLLFNYSSWPMKALTFLGVAISILSFALGAFYIAYNYTVGINVPGWTTIVVLVAFLNGFIIMMLGVIGEYLVGVLNNVSDKRSYYVRKVIKK